MKSILLSIKPKYVALIASGKKTIEVRKSAPKEVPFKAYIYCTKGKDGYEWLYRVDNNGYGKAQSWHGKVIGEFICNEVEEFHEWELSPQGKFADFERERLENFLTAACLSEEEVVRYRENLPYFKPLYGWHISDLKIYDKPKELSDFYRPCSYSGICYSCNRFRPNGTPNDEPNDFCDGEITRPPQSYMFVEELGE